VIKFFHVQKRVFAEIQSEVFSNDIKSDADTVTYKMVQNVLYKCLMRYHNKFPSFGVSSQLTYNVGKLQNPIFSCMP